MKDIVYWGNTPESLKVQIDCLSERERYLKQRWYKQTDNFIGLMLWLVLCVLPLMLLGLGFIAVQIWGPA